MPMQKLTTKALPSSEQNESFKTVHLVASERKANCLSEETMRPFTTKSKNIHLKNEGLIKGLRQPYFWLAIFAMMKSLYCL